MKHAILILTAIVACSFATGEQPTTTQQNQYVYICTGPASKRYHKKQNCRGLSACNGDIIQVTLAYAREHKRTPCGICHPFATII